MGDRTVSDEKDDEIHIHDNEGGGQTCLKNRGNDPFNIGKKFGSIPANLLANVVAWIVLIVSRSCLWITSSDSILADVVLHCPQEPDGEAHQHG